MSEVFAGNLRTRVRFPPTPRIEIMSATNELLLEKIDEFDSKIAEATRAGDVAEVKRLITEKDRVRSYFSSSVTSLAEGKMLLKG